MRDGSRIFATVAGALVVFVVIVAGMGAYWWSHRGAAWFAEGKVAFEEGRALGPSGDNHMCLDHSLDRFRACDGMGCEIGALVFLNACLGEAAPHPDFCDGVPAKTAVIRSVTWRLERCEAAGFVGETCGQLFASVQGYCDGLRMRGVLSARSASPDAGDPPIAPAP